MKKQKKPTIRQKVRNALYYLGKQAKPKEVVDSLAKSGLSVTEDFAEQVRFEELKQRRHQQGTSQSLNRVGKPQQIQKIPQKRPRRR